jgi:hypothetical protein
MMLMMLLLLLLSATMIMAAAPFGAQEGKLASLSDAAAQGGLIALDNESRHRRRREFTSTNDWYFRQVDNNKLDVGLKEPRTPLHFKAYILFNPSGELASKASLGTMCRIWESWVRPNIEVTLAIPKNNQQSMEWLQRSCSSSVGRMVVLEEEAYPPVKLELAMWKQAAELLEDSPSLRKRTFLIKLDMDTHFNPSVLLRESSKLNMMTKYDYFGTPGSGRHNEYREQPYCQGFSYFIRATAMKAFTAKHAPLPPNIVNSDVAVGYVLGEVCQPLTAVGLAPTLLTNNFMVVDKDGKAVQRTLQGKGFGDNLQMQLEMFSSPPTSELTAISIHPIKSTVEFARFNIQTKLGLRASLYGLSGPKEVAPAANVDSNGKDYKRFMTLYRSQFLGSCVANFADQVCTKQDALPPCNYRDSETTDLQSLRGVTIAVPTLNLHVTKADFASQLPAMLGLELKVVQMTAYTTNAKRIVAEKRVMSRIMQRFLADSSAKLLVVARDSVRFHPNFPSLYAGLDSYCFDGISTSGVLILGASVSHRGEFTPQKLQTSTLNGDIGGDKLIAYEQSQTGSKCYSGHAAVVDSYATVYSRGAANFVLQFLSRRKKLDTQVFDHLMHLGVPVRVANNPELVALVA